MFDEHGFGHHRAGTAGTGESGNGGQQMQKQNGQIAHRLILPRSEDGPRMLANLEFATHNILDSVERGEWRSARAPKRALSRYGRAAKATFKKDRRLNIRISTKDLEAIQKRALEEGLPYQP